MPWDQEVSEAPGSPRGAGGNGEAQNERGGILNLPVLQAPAGLNVGLLQAQVT